MLIGRKSRAEKVAMLAAAVVMDSVVSVLFVRHCCSVFPAFLAHHFTEEVHGLHKITQLQQNQARTLT